MRIPAIEIAGVPQHVALDLATKFLAANLTSTALAARDWPALINAIIARAKLTPEAYLGAALQVSMINVFVTNTPTPPNVDADLRMVPGVILNIMPREHVSGRIMEEVPLDPWLPIRTIT